MIGDVADIMLLFERDGKRRSVVGLSTQAARCQRTAYKVVLVVADPGANTVPEWATL